MAYGKAIELFLVDGDANGLVTAELSNWNGKAIKIPRTDVKDCTRHDITEAGVYFLFCQEDDGSDSVYIGEAENVQKRLIQHHVCECGAVSFKGHELTGVCLSKRLNVVDVTLEARKLNPTIPNDMYIVEEANIDGILVWQNASGAVYISMPGTSTPKVAGSLQEYLKL